MQKLLKEVRTVEIKTKHLVDTLMAGNFHSIFRGQGIEFSEIRDYAPGDDPRSIDWKVTARFNHPFVKEFIEERDLRIYVIIDFSASSNFGDSTTKKRKQILLASTIMFSALKNNDLIGLIIGTETVEKFVPAKKGKKHVLGLIAKMLEHKTNSKKTNLSEIFRFTGNILKRKSIIFIISDFLTQELDFVKQLRHIKKRHDVVVMRTYDDNEQYIPDVGYIELEDEESGEQIMVNTSDKLFRERYKQLIEKEEEKLSKIFLNLKIDCVQISTNGSFIAPLKRFFSMRKYREVR